LIHRKVFGTSEGFQESLDLKSAGQATKRLKRNADQGLARAKIKIVFVCKQTRVLKGAVNRGLAA
jgi:hypothetical protein